MNDYKLYRLIRYEKIISSLKNMRYKDIIVKQIYGQSTKNIPESMLFRFDYKGVEYILDVDVLFKIMFCTKTQNNIIPVKKRKKKIETN